MTPPPVGDSGVAAVGSLFPHLPLRSRRAFHLGLAVVFLLLTVQALLRCQAPMIAISALGVPIMFVLSLYDVHRELRVPPLVSTAVMGIGLGVGWALLTGSFVADFYDVSFVDADTRRLAALVNIAVPVGGAIVMLLPAVVMRFVRPVRDWLDGFVFGALGALAFTAAAVLTRLAPQFATGVTAGDRPVTMLLVQAALQGVAIPVTAAATGGLVGAALWFGRRALIAASVLTTVAVYAAFGIGEAVPGVEGVHLVVHLVIAAVALLALRIGLRHCVLHQARAEPSYHAVRCTTSRWLLTTLSAGLTVAAAAGITAAVLATPPRPRYTCPPDCGRPPIGEPVDTNPRFVSADGEFSVQYPGPGSLYKASLYPDWVEMDYVGGDTGTMDLWGEAAQKRSPKQIVDAMIADYYPDAALDYEIPHAMVGYEPGYGAVYDDYPQDPSGEFTRLRVVALCAVRDDYALVATAVGPYHEFTPDYGSGHPSGANLELALDFGKFVNSFRWHGAPTG